MIRVDRIGVLGAWASLCGAVLSCAALVGCDDGEPADPVPMPDQAPIDASLPVDGPAMPSNVDATTGGGWIELGTGARRFAPLEAGQEVPVIQGIQGGFHVWGGFRGGGFADDDVRLRFFLELDGESIGRADYTEYDLPTEPRDESVYSYAGVAVVYDDNDTVEPTSGRTMTLRVELTASDGQVMRDAIELVPVCCE